jgi:hypothetical protein
VVAHWTSNCADKKCSRKSNDVGVGNLVLGQVHVCFDALA